MMRGRERTTKSSTSLTISHKRIGKEQAGLSRKTIRNLAGFAHKAILHLDRVVDRTAVTDNRVLANHARTNKYRGVHRTHHCTLRQPRSSTDLAITLNDCVRDILCIDYLHVIPDVTTFWSRYTEFVLNHLLEGLLQHLIVLVLYHERCQLTIQFTEDGDVAITHLVENTDYGAFTIRCIVSSFQSADIRNIAVVTNSVVINVVAHLLY